MEIINVILDEMKRALMRGHDVEFPFGKLTVVKRHFSQYWDAAKDWPASRSGYTVEWELNEASDRQLNDAGTSKKPGRQAVRIVK